MENGEAIQGGVLNAVIEHLAHENPGTQHYNDMVMTAIKEKNLCVEIRSHLNENSPEGDRTLAAQAIAELAKAEPARELLLNEGFIPLLVSLLRSSDMDQVLQSVRAMGNLCYEQDKCREAILDQGGLKLLYDLLLLLNKKPNQHISVKIATCGFLHNLVNGNENLQKAAIECNIVSAVKPMLELHSNVEPLCNFCYMALSSVLETEGGNEVIMESGVFKILLKLFINSDIKNTEELLLNLLTLLLADSEEAKRVVSESSADMHLLNIISTLTTRSARSPDDDDMHIIKGASEFIVLVLTGDEAMKIWFEGGNGLIFTTVCEWLSSPNGQLLQSAAFALGNFARDDENSSILIQKGISTELCNSIDQLAKYKDDDRVAPTVHAILSALRNMAIAPRNKEQLLQQHIVNRLRPLLSSNNPLVTSKLMGVFRLLIDKQVAQAQQFGNDKEFISRIIELSAEDKSPTLKGESLRCLAWIVKNGRDHASLQNVVKHGGLPCLSTLLTTEFPIMQNEGLLSLILIAKTLAKELVVSSFTEESSIFTNLKNLITGEKQPSPDVLSNCLMLIHALLQAGLQEQVSSMDIITILRELSISQSPEKQEARSSSANLAKSILQSLAENGHVTKM